MEEALWENEKTQFNSLSDNKLLTLYKIKAIADDKINMTKKLKFVLATVENVVGKSSILSFFLNIFKGLLSQGFLKSGLCGKNLTLYLTTKFPPCPEENICT